MKQPVAYPRVELRKRFRSWARESRALIAGLLAITLALLVLETALVLGLWGSGSAAKWYFLGFLHSAILAAALAGIGLGFLTHDARAMWLVRGAWGEDNTRDELKRASRRRVIWGWVDSVQLQAGDIDHLVVTRAAGLIAIDTKWRTVVTAQDQAEMARAAAKVRLRADALVQQLLSREHGRHRDAKKVHRVTPVLVLWGPERHRVPEGFQLEGIDVIDGGDLLKWLKRQSGDRIDKVAGREIIRLLATFRQSAADAQSR